VAKVGTSNSDRTINLRLQCVVKKHKIPTFSQGIKGLGRDVDHSPVSSSEVKNEWSHALQFPCMIRGLYGKTRAFYLYFR